ncbi:MAG: DUF3124 domain-containing protein [Magnetospirillum sp.]|nr:DUF3124 domain-containing protein [Magnetospirillum sp.]
MIPPTLRTAIVACALSLGGGSVLAGDDLPLVSRGQTVYVPVYSHVLHGNQDRQGKPGTWLLSAMLSIRNVDPAAAVTIRSIRYYDTEGAPIRDYLPQPQKLGPMATTEVFVEHKDTAGGSGANFLVVWDADKPVNVPIVETVHTNFFGTQSVAFTSRGQAIAVGGR